MWNKKERCQNPFADKVKCEECKCWLDKSDAIPVDTSTIYGNGALYYCCSHKKKYKKVIYLDVPPYIIYIGEIQVDDSGEPIGYKKMASK